MSGEGASREEVLGWMRTEGKGWRSAAERFPSISAQTIKSWARRAGAGRGAGAHPGTHPAKGGGGRKAATVAEVAGRVEPRTPARELRARAAAAALGPEIIRDLRRGVASLTRFVAVRAEAAATWTADPDDENSRPPDMRPVADAARALEALLTRSADILGFDAATNPASAETDADLRAARLAVALKVDPKAPPTLTVLRGARADEAP